MRRGLFSLLVIAAGLGRVAARAKAPPSVSTSRKARWQEPTLSAAAPKKRWQEQMLFRERMIAGSAARGVAQTVLHPIDVARTRLQAKGVAMSWTARTFIKGISPQFVLALPADAIQFAAYEASKDLKCVPEIVCGAIGALAASVIRVPQEVLKQRVQADIYPNALQGARTLLSTEGPKGLYKGYLATISRDVPWNALTFAFMAQAKKLFTKFNGRSPGVEENLVLGALSGMTAAVIMTPIDVVKTRLMTGAASGGILETLNAIVADEGALTLMKGVVPRCAFLAPMAAITLALYESFAKQLVAKRLAVPVADL